MKKGNLFLTLVFIAMAVLVGVGSMFATFAQAQDMALQVAAASGDAKGTKLFNDNGTYAVEYNDLKNGKGKIYNFFGYDWWLVNFNGDEAVATFWMVDPYGSNDTYRYVFNKQVESGNTNTSFFEEGKTLWRNGYSKTEWNGETVGESDAEIASDLKNTMGDIAKAIIDNAAYKNYKDKVVAGYVAGSNTSADQKSISAVYCSVEGTTSLDEIVSPAQSMTAYYGLDSSDRLWLPATEEIMNGGTWNLTNTERNWDRTTVDKVVWLRTPVTNHSAMAQLVGYDKTISNAELGADPVTQEESFFKHYVDQKHGVRPAVHLSLKSFSEDNGNANKGGWFTDDMMKVFFIIICVLGIIGVILVITAVVIKARRDKAAQNG